MSSSAWPPQPSLTHSLHLSVSLSRSFPRPNDALASQRDEGMREAGGGRLRTWRLRRDSLLVPVAHFLILQRSEKGDGRTDGRTEREKGREAENFCNHSPPRADRPPPHRAGCKRAANHRNRRSHLRSISLEPPPAASTEQARQRQVIANATSAQLVAYSPHARR